MKKLLVVQLVALTAFAMAEEKRMDSQAIQRDGISVVVGGKNGYSIKVDGTPFSALSGLYVVDPPWKQVYYAYGDDKGRIAEAELQGNAGNPTGIVYRLHSDRSQAVEGTQTLELLPGRRMRIATDIRMTTDSPGVIENRIASIGEAWLSNVEWDGELKDGTTTSGRAARWAPATTPKEATLVSDLKRLKFHSPAGEWSVETSGSAEVALVDYRRSDWAEGQKFFWLGVLGSRLPADEVFSYEVMFTFPAKKANSEGNSLSARPDLQTSATVYRAQPPEDRIIPTPKQVTWEGGLLRADGDVLRLVFQSDPNNRGAGPESVISSFFKRMEKQHGLKVSRAGDVNGILRISLDTKFNLPDWQAEEAYRLKIDDKTIRLDCQTSTGLMNGLRTLEQLVRRDDSGKAGFRLVEVFDFPAMPFRGIHFFSGKDARDLQLKMVAEILAPLKINRLVYQVDYIKWDSQPQIHSDVYGMEKSDAKVVADAAEAQGIDVIPLVNTFGHSEWLLQRPSMRYLADDPNDPYAYDPSNPKVYEICEEIYREAIALFKPTIMHIGHDEIHLDGFPKKPENKAVGATQLVINDIKHYHAFLKKQGIRTMMWGDMFLGPGEAPDAALAPSVEEAKRRRELLPKDIIITDWHYKSAPVSDYGSMGIFAAAGFDVIACPWFAPDNIVRLAKATALELEETDKMMGLLQTTWAGYSFDDNSLTENMPQYAAYVLAAEAAWTGGTTDSKNVPFDYNEEFLRRWVGDSRGGTGRTGWMASLDEVANTTLDEAKFHLADGALEGLKPGVMAMGNYVMKLPRAGNKIGAVVLEGTLDLVEKYPNEAAFNLDSHANVIYIALATPAAMPDGTAVGSVTLVMEDGSTKSEPLKYGRNVMSLGDGRQTLLAPVVWKSKQFEMGQGGAAIHVLRLDNPKPGTPVKQLKLHADKSGPGLVLFGLSGN